MKSTLDPTTSGQVQPRVDKQAALPSGRSVRIRVQGDQEWIEVRGPEGDLQVEVRFDQEGPVLSLVGARIELESLGSLVLRGEDVVIAAERTATLSAGDKVALAGGKGSIHMQEDLELRGRSIHLNP